MSGIRNKTLDNDRLSVLCAELAEILRSGLTLGEGFMLIAEEEQEPALKEVYESLYRETRDGGALAPAMQKAGVFPDYMLRMTVVAEKTGALEKVMRELSAYYDRQARLRRSLRSAVGYPLLLFFIILVVFFIFLTEVLPVFSRVFAQIGAEMLPAAVVFLNLGEWLRGARWWILAFVGVLAAAAAVIYLVPSLREKAGGWFGGLFAGTRTGKKVRMSRVASALSLAVSGASDVAEAMEMVADFAHEIDRDGRVAACRDLVLGGKNLADAAAETDILSPVYCRMLSIGERTGSIDELSADVARRASEDAQSAMDALTGRIEPAAVIILTLLVGLLLLSVMLPLIGVMSAL